MGFRKAIVKSLGLWKVSAFLLRKALLGFENANSMLRTLDKRFAIDILRRHGAEIGDDTDIETPLLVHNAGDSYRNLRIGAQCHVGKNVLLDLRDEIVIGNRVTVSMGVTIITHTDVGRSNISDHYPQVHGKVSLGDDCYVGASATILQSVSLDKSCVVGAGSLVSRSFPGSSVIGGVPARVLKKLNT